MQPDTSAECLVQLLQQLQVPATRRGVYEELRKHPEHPSLLAISDVLTAWGIPNEAYRVGHDELPTVPTPFLAHLATNGGEFRLIEQVEGTRITSAPTGSRPAAFTPEEFNQAFTGNVLLAETRPGAGEPQYQQRRRREQAERLRPALLLAA